MVCKNCGEQLKSGEKFCTVCGYYNDPDDVSMERFNDVCKNIDKYEIIVIFECTQ